MRKRKSKFLKQKFKFFFLHSNSDDRIKQRGFWRRKVLRPEIEGTFVHARVRAYSRHPRKFQLKKVPLTETWEFSGCSLQQLAVFWDC